MTKVIKLTGEKTKEDMLLNAIKDLNSGKLNSCCHMFAHKELEKIPGAPFSYWVSNEIRDKFISFDNLGMTGEGAKQGIATADDFRFVRNWWEVELGTDVNWVPFAKGGSYARYHADVNLVVRWDQDGREIKNFADVKTGKIRSRPQNVQYSMLPGLTWSDRTTSLFSARIWPENGIFSIKGSAGFFYENNFHVLALMNSTAFNYLLSLMVGAADSAAKSYQVGTLNKVPLPPFSKELNQLSTEVWRLYAYLDSMNEDSHFFELPLALRDRDLIHQTVREIDVLENKINKLCFELYSFSSDDIAAAEQQLPAPKKCFSFPTKEKELDDLLLWCIGILFGRFGYTSENNREQSLTRIPEPFKALREVSPAMEFPRLEDVLCSNGIIPQGGLGSRNLSNLVTNVLNAVDYPVPMELVGWIDSRLFDVVLAKYSKSRRQAPIYWPLSSRSGSLSLWVYCHKLNSQTLLSCINEYIDPKLQELTEEILLLNSNREKSRKDEKALDSAINVRVELEEFRDEILRLSTFWQPYIDDGIQVSAAPLWRLFQHKSWQKKLKQTWEKLEEGDYDWAQTAYTIWPERVLKKCHSDRSIAIAHGVESDLWHEVEVLKGKKKEPVWEWQPKPLSPAELNDYVREKITTDERLALYRSNAKNSGVKP